MSGGTRIIAFDSASVDAAGDEILLTEEAAEVAESTPEWEDSDEEKAVTGRGGGWILPLIGGLLLFGWTGFFAWAMRERIAAPLAPEQWIGLIRDWAVPVVLLAIAALLVMRNSRREALRFGKVAHLLSVESAQLETRLSVVNRELSLAREFLAAQSRDLETLGRLAADKLSTEADRLQGLIRDNHARVETIGTVSAAALDNMEKLRGQLPVIASSAKDVTNNIGNAGRTAHSQLQDMIGGFGKLHEVGQASERQVQVLRGLIEETIGEFSRQTAQFGDIASARFAEFHEKGAEFRLQLESHEIEALAAVRSRASAMAAELEEMRGQLDGSEAESLTSMRARLSALREEGNAISRALRDGENRALESWQANVARMKDNLQGALASLHEAEAQAIAASQTRLGEMSSALEQLEQRALEQAGTFTAEIGKRHAEAAAAEESAVNNLREHLAALDLMTRSTRERHGEIEQAALEQLRQRLAALDSEIAGRRERHDDLEREAIDGLRVRLAALDEEMAERRARHETQGAAIVAQGEAIAAQLAQFESRAAEIAAHGNQVQESIGASLQTLTDQLAASRTALSGTDREIAALTNSSVRLLELIQASMAHSSQELPQALTNGEAQLANIETRMAALCEAARETDARGANLIETIDAATSVLQGTHHELGSLHAKLEATGSLHAQTLAGLRQELDGIASQSQAVTQDTRAQLTSALGELARSTQAVVKGFGENGAAAVAALTRQLSDGSAGAIEQAMQASTAATARQLEQAVSQAASVSREAALQLREQLGKVNELAGNLESRVAHARERAEEQVDNDFTRRVALITESLNSNAIDIAKALSTDVADTAWAAYLRGDRGIFTRRAVSLIDSAEAKAIAQIYARDLDFHEHVSRYIHDFEAMLRQVLSARDGQALGVTLLSSDMGKLYVALAQAIKRLRS